ncbi:MAG: hypothetical protein AB7Q17_00990 [Phycisphaerae bacterium]
MTRRPCAGLLAVTLLMGGCPAMTPEPPADAVAIEAAEYAGTLVCLVDVRPSGGVPLAPVRDVQTAALAVVIAADGAVTLDGMTVAPGALLATTTARAATRKTITSVVVQPTQIVVDFTAEITSFTISPPRRYVGAGRFTLAGVSATTLHYSEVTQLTYVAADGAILATFTCSANVTTN